MKKKIRVVLSVVFCLAVACMMSGCGVSHKSPEGVVKSLVSAYDKGKVSRALDCYGVDKEDKDTSKIIQANIDYYEAMKADGLTVQSCEIIEDFKEYAFVHIFFTVKLGKEKEYPKMDTFLTKVKDDKYYVIPTKDVTAEMAKATESAYATFMLSDTYKEYLKAYDAFVLKNPQFEENLANKLKQ